MSDRDKPGGDRPIVRNRAQRSQAVTDCWRKFPMLGAAQEGREACDFRKARISAVFRIWHGARNTLCMTGGWSAGRQKEINMSVSFNLQKLALSVFGALVASSLFLTAAVGPVPIV